MHEKKHYHRVLTIAGSDSGGGAGIQADLKTIAANHCYGMSVITALTAQNTLGVSAIHAVPVDFVAAQMDAVLSDIADGLRRYEAKNIVLDPVMVAQSGDKLLQDEAVAALKEHLIPLADLITPNLPEASVLLDREILTEEDLAAAAVDLAALGAGNVLIKGGHLESENSDDCLYLGAERRLVTLAGERVVTRNNHGTGCTLSSAIAAYLARGEDMETAVRLGKDYIAGAIQAGAAYEIGHGNGPVHHFFRSF
jgi:hydroxymethylpyrimidine/phosphomethylpyrimidine kinase